MLLAVCNPVRCVGYHQPLPGGFEIGQSIVAMFNFQGVERGHVGNVCGPCNNQQLTNPEDRINCNFSTHNGCGNLNVLSTQVHPEGETPALPGGYAIGNPVLPCCRAAVLPCHHAAVPLPRGLVKVARAR